MANKIQDDLIKLADKKKAILLSRYFKTAEGEYGEGDIFLGISVGSQRNLIKKYFGLEPNDLQLLLDSKIHEFRFSAILILVDQYKKSEQRNKKVFFDFYIKNIKNINNWDLVDVSAPNILGDYLFGKKRDLLYKMAKSKNLWERRAAVVATLFFIKSGDLNDIFRLAKNLLHDKHDLIHKAVGWMLREAGKKDIKRLESFLIKNKDEMPRTMLRYAIEKMPEKQRKLFLKK
ncbi:DNA alkylation repair protein [Candidatus Falkowbacteria bacterium HGW-Falkowbacteria-1]|jgi:3-methyladenine DNA glycosylase AlkD|uniref:DNA alkylation repair protein n=1 Tax=Candidatus Falkowbacteria bacterium HGW-Falkowbacteria-1 TaxID=2013768 RepID=A0A2N2E9P6_9BACT|nr:MAG: DNA alkylation repair protein [Candidatus Falkowbacteria bacterium HGW-Falkowbacteria-1]